MNVGVVLTIYEHVHIISVRLCSFVQHQCTATPWILSLVATGRKAFMSVDMRITN